MKIIISLLILLGTTAVAMNLNSYQGESALSSLYPAFYGGQATYKALIGVQWIAKDIVRANLPSEYSLKNPQDTHHPVIFMLGRQEKTGTFSGPFYWPTFMPYDEIIILIPYVFGDRQVSHTYVHSMYLDNIIATWGGNLNYGYQKSFFPLKWRKNTSSNQLFWRGQSVASFNITNDGQLNSDQRFIYETITGTQVIGTVLGVPICSTFDWRSKRGTHFSRVSSYHFTGLPLPLQNEVNTNPTQAFYVEDIVWKVNWPAWPGGCPEL